MVLQKQLEVCGKYLLLQREMTKALILGDIKQIDMIVREEQTYNMKIENLEKQRTKILEQEQLSEIKISEIIENHIEDEKEQFTEVSDKLLCILFDMRKVNDLNQRLLKQRLSVFEGFLEMPDANPVMRA